MRVMVFEGTPGEVSDLLERFPQLNPSALPPSGAGGGPAAESISPKVAVWTKERITAMWNCLYGDQQKLVEYIVRRGGRVTLAGAQKHLGFSKGPEIAGVMSSITRNARRITKYREARVVEDWINQKAHSWGYCLPKHILPVLLEVLVNRSK